MPKFYRFFPRVFGAFPGKGSSKTPQQIHRGGGNFTPLLFWPLTNSSTMGTPAFLPPPSSSQAAPGTGYVPTTAILGGTQRKRITTYRISLVLSAVRLGLWLPSIFRRRRSFSAGRSPAGRRAAAQGGTQGGGTTPPQRILRSCWAGEGLWAYQEGQMGKKMPRFGQRGQRDPVKTSR
jgi:hypothetical protein